MRHGFRKESLQVLWVFWFHMHTSGIWLFSSAKCQSSSIDFHLLLLWKFFLRLLCSCCFLSLPVRFFLLLSFAFESFFSFFLLTVCFFRFFRLFCLLLSLLLLSFSLCFLSYFVSLAVVIAYLVCSWNSTAFPSSSWNSLCPNWFKCQNYCQRVAAWTRSCLCELYQCWFPFFWCPSLPFTGFCRGPPSRQYSYTVSVNKCNHDDATSMVMCILLHLQLCWSIMTVIFFFLKYSWDQCGRVLRQIFFADRKCQSVIDENVFVAQECLDGEKGLFTSYEFSGYTCPLEESVYLVSRTSGFPPPPLPPSFSISHCHALIVMLCFLLLCFAQPHSETPPQPPPASSNSPDSSVTITYRAWPFERGSRMPLWLLNLEWHIFPRPSVF